MKKILIVCLACMLSACSLIDKVLPKEDEVVVIDENETETEQETEKEVVPVERISIRDVDFTQSQAENLMRAAIREHCGDRVCYFDSASISDGNVVGRYYYKNEEDEDVFVDVVLKDVTVSSQNHTIAFYGENYFSDDEVSEEGAEGETNVFEEVAAVGNYKFDLPAEVSGDVGLFEEVLKDGSTVVYRVNLSSGYFKIYGDVQDGGAMKATLMKLDQTNQKVFVDHTGAGHYEGDITVEPGVYYLVCELIGYLTYYWSM